MITASTDATDRGATTANADTPSPLLGTAAPSPAGPITAEELAQLPAPPTVALPRPVQMLRFNQRQVELVFGARRRLGETFRIRGVRPGGTIITSHPDHVRSIYTASPEDAPSLTGESPLRPIVGPNSTLTAVGARHLRQRRLLLPAFHGEAIARYSAMIEAAAHREIDRWPQGRPFALAPRMQAITLNVIMSGIFGIDGAPKAGTAEWALRLAVRRIMQASAWPGVQLSDLVNAGRTEPVGLLRLATELLDRPTYAVIAKRRADRELETRTDILSMLMRTEDEDGTRLTDQELRDELVGLVLAGHETTANSLAWTWERLVRTPDAYDRLRRAVRRDEDADAWIDATIWEGMRVRPVVAFTGRMMTRPWQLGPYGIPAQSAVLLSVMLVHHREDLYPDPFAFRPERWIGAKPGTYTWIPFGGGIRRCVGASLATAEQQVVLRAMTERLELEADRPQAERIRSRNVTQIPSRGARVVARQI